MSTPGVSLFQGNENIQINTSIEKAEEEEALEDQRRRNEELGNLLQNAFDDLEDDETTVDSTNNLYGELNQVERLPAQQQRQQHQMPAAQPRYEMDMQKLNFLLESRNRELDTFKQMTQDEIKKREELQKRLAITEAELNRALAAKKNTHELLVECKERCSNLECTINKLKSDKKCLEAENNELLGKLETAQALLSDVQRKYDMVERDMSRHNERSAELKRKQAEERHRAELEMMQQQLDQLNNKLERKTHEYDNMQTRYRALQNSHELMLVDKASKINELNSALDEAQRKCEELLSREDYFQENVRLQKLVANLQNQISGMEHNILTLNERLEQTTDELDVLDGIVQKHGNEETPRRTSNAAETAGAERNVQLKDELYRAVCNVRSKREEIRQLRETLHERNMEIKKLKLEENNSLVQITTLKEEKLRLENRLRVLEKELQQHSLQNEEQHKIKQQQDKLQLLQQQKSELEQQCHELQETHMKNENALKQLNAQLKNTHVDLEELKQENESLKRNYKQLEEECNELRSRKTADAVSLELEKHKYLLKDAQTECDRLKTLYADISNAKEGLSYELEKLRATDAMKQLRDERERAEKLQRALQLAEMKASELTKILEAEKQCHERELAALKEKLDKERSEYLKENKNTSNNCTKCVDYVAEITKREIENLKLTTEISNCKKETDEFVRKLNESKQLIMELSSKLQLSEQQEQLIRELKAKAQQFEEYIKSQSSTPRGDKAIQTAENSPTATEGALPRAEVKKIEERLRQEMAKVFARDLKLCQQKMLQTLEDQQLQQQQYKQLHAELIQRQTEVEVLKQAILTERDGMQQLLREKEDECSQLLLKQNAMIQKYREELQLKHNKLQELAKEASERQTQIEAERQSMKAVMSQWEQERNHADDVEKEWKQKMLELKSLHDSAINSWSNKYKSAKLTALNYKRYAEDKEVHMMKEYERLKTEYESALSKLRNRLQGALDKEKGKQLNETAHTSGSALDKEHEANKENEPNN